MHPRAPHAAPFALLLLLAIGGPAWANVPAAFLPCEGAAPGDPCRLVGGTHATCVLDTLCEPDPDEVANRCLLCVDPCWGQAEDTACIRLTGEPGVCQQQDRCTLNPEKSFDECNRCVEGTPSAPPPTPTAAQDAGCTTGAVPGLFEWAPLAPWALLLAGLVVTNRRRD